MNERKNAMLTTEDRRWLTGEKSYEGEHAKQQRYQRRRDIRQRVYNAILDFGILFEHLEEAEREKLFEHLSGSGVEYEDDEFASGLRDGLAFVLYNTGITEAMVRDDSERSAVVAEQFLEDAIYAAGKRDEFLVEDVDLTIEASPAPIAALLEDLKVGNDLSPAGLRLLMESDKIDTAEVQDCIKGIVFDDE
ncbi:hypothetical protein GWG54_12270 [Natronococcus sp. JC468]|uniref:hypothetical protein n=1 Tax=Natronococcus sp. JC468 TaxID=1961921 RepID=UPI00143961BC|nr:hypothetical protein [Natronococcus sp. JC468]NKE36580.1 hypothetical protein [Natronococcus sp. JC468]